MTSITTKPDSTQPASEMAVDLDEVLNLKIWRGASFVDANQQTSFGEPGKGAPPWRQDYLPRSARVKSWRH